MLLFLLLSGVVAFGDAIFQLVVLDVQVFGFEVLLFIFVRAPCLFCCGGRFTSESLVGWCDCQVLSSSTSSRLTGPPGGIRLLHRGRLLKRWFWVALREFRALNVKQVFALENVRGLTPPHFGVGRSPPGPYERVLCGLGRTAGPPCRLSLQVFRFAGAVFPSYRVLV